MGSIFRTVKNADNPFVMVDKRPINDKELTWAAKGMLAYLLSKPDDWKIILENLENQSPDGRDKVRTVINELTKAGYIKKFSYRISGKFQTDYEVYESRQPISDTVTAKPTRLDGDGKTDTTNNDLLIQNTNTVTDVPLSIENQIYIGSKITKLPDDNENEYRDNANLLAMTFGINAERAYAIAFTFMKTRQIVIPQSKIKGQRKAVQEMIEGKVNASHVEQAVKQLLANNMTVSDLYSVAKTAIAIANPAPSGGKPKKIDGGFITPKPGL